MCGCISVYAFIGSYNRVFIVNEKEDIEAIQQAFEDMDAIYIADGHHRCASAVKVGLKRRKEIESIYFLSVLFDEDECQILDYNRVVKDLNGLDEETFLKKIEENFSVNKLEVREDVEEYKPKEQGTFVMYLNNEWFELKFNKTRSDDPIEGLDVSILQNYLLKPVLGIKDPRVDERIDFVGGIRGLKEIQRRCESDMKVGFGLVPTSIQQLFSVADAGLLMPPKSTWFEPKLLSGLFIHSLEK